MIFLSDQGQDEYINLLAQGHGYEITDSRNFRYEDSDQPIVLRGILKYKLMRQCWKDNRTFFYIDSGYFGNSPNPLNPRGHKHWHRIVKNDIQHSDIRSVPNDRWRKLCIEFEPRKHGKKIIVAAPDEKPGKFYDIDVEAWLHATLNTLSSYTDRPIEVRQRSKSRQHRTISDPLSKVLEDDVHALVTFNSNAAVESILKGVPAFVLAPVHAAKPVSNSDLQHIENPYWPSYDKLYAWANSLAHGQFHIDEFRQGQVLKHLI